MTLGKALRQAAPHLFGKEEEEEEEEEGWEFICQVRLSHPLPTYPPTHPPTYTQGLSVFPSLAEIPAVEVWAALRHPDFFLYVVARRRRR